MKAKGRRRERKSGVKIYINGESRTYGRRSERSDPNDID